MAIPQNLSFSQQIAPAGSSLQNQVGAFNQSQGRSSSALMPQNMGGMDMASMLMAGGKAMGGDVDPYSAVAGSRPQIQQFGTENVAQRYSPKYYTPQQQQQMQMQKMMQYYQSLPTSLQYPR